MILDQFITAATVGCSVFLAILAFLKKSNTPKGYQFIAIIFVLLAVTFSDELLADASIYNRHPLLLIIFQPVLYAFGPVIYLSVVYLTNPGKRISARTFFHFIPYLLIVVLYVLSYHSTKNGQVKENDEIGNYYTSLVEIFLLAIFFIQIFTYLYLSIKRLSRHKRTLQYFVSSIADNDYHWLRNTIIGLIILSLISCVEVVFDEMHVESSFAIIYLVGLYYIGVQVIRQKNVFPFSENTEDVESLINSFDSLENKTSEHEGDAPISDSINQKIILPKKGISEDKMASYKQRLLVLMETEKPYLNSDITLPKLGKKLLLNTYQTSYLINNCFGENFYTFINRYRVEEFKQFLINGKYNHLTMLGIAFEAGFNSKTAFNTSFKKSTGLSPKEFKQQMHAPITIRSSDLSSR